MKLKIFYNGSRVSVISLELRVALEERVEMQLIEALAPFDHELSKHDYTINISFSLDFQSITIFMEGLSGELTKITEASIARVLKEMPVFADNE